MTAINRYKDASGKQLAYWCGHCAAKVLAGTERRNTVNAPLCPDCGRVVRVNGRFKTRRQRHGFGARYMVFCKTYRQVIATFPASVYPHTIQCPHCGLTVRLWHAHTLNSIHHMRHFVLTRHQFRLVDTLRRLGWTLPGGVTDGP